MLLMVFLVAGTGCIYVPTFEHYHGRDVDFRPLVGPAASDKPIRPGRTTRAQAVVALGEPYQQEEQASLLAYKYEPVKGYMLSPFGHFNWPYFHSRYLYLRFDSGGVLAVYRLVTEPYFDNNAVDFERELTDFAASTRSATRPTS